MGHRVGTKGQVVIEKAIRNELGIEAGAIAVQRRVGDHVELRFFPAEHSRSLLGILAGPVPADLDEDDWEGIRSEAWRKAAEAKASGTPSDD